MELKLFFNRKITFSTSFFKQYELYMPGRILPVSLVVNLKLDKTFLSVRYRKRTS